jgi:hypothetical protein
MADFRTVLTFEESKSKIDHHSKVFSMGSCFAEHITQRMDQRKFNTMLNPFGILYNPISIAMGMAVLMGQKQLSEAELFAHNGLWHSFFFHGKYSGQNQQQVWKEMGQAVVQGTSFLQQADWMICTFGTAYVFEHKQTAQVVANCHKLPNQDFDRRRLGVNEIIDVWEQSLGSLWQLNPDLKVLLTVSPIRHIRDGLVENQRSKAALLLAVEQLCTKYPKVQYFPAYELMMDDLRDYRFYESDLIHPNAQAIDYIWDKFSKVYFDTPTKELNSRIERMVQAALHRPLHPGTEAHQAFLRQQLDKIQDFAEEYPNLSFEQEKELFLAQLTN